MPEKFNFSKTEDQKEFKNLLPDEKEQIVNKAKNEASLMQKKVINGDAWDYYEANLIIDAEKEEKELSPEVIKEIMAKVQDVNNEGIGYHVIRNYASSRRDEKDKILSGMFRKGLFSNISIREDSLFFANYRHNLKEKKFNFQFNIVGRTRDLKGGQIDIMLSEYANIESGYIFLFDISHFEEIDNKNIFGLDTKNKKTMRSNQYCAVSNFTRKGEKTDDEYGFMLAGRLAPRYFRGIIINPHVPGDADQIEENNNDREKRKSKEQKIIEESLVDDNLLKFRFGLSRRELLKSIETERQENKLALIYLKNRLESEIYHNGYMDENWSKILQSRAANMMKEIYKDRQKLMIPIYDYTGNLLWPKKMSYEEVKKFVAEREKKKGEKE